VHVIEALLEHSHRFVSPSLQIVMGQFIEKNHLYKHLKNLIEVAQERKLLFENLFTEGNKLLHINPRSFNSLHLMSHFRQEVKPQEEKQLIEKLGKHNLSAYSLSKCYIQEKPQTGLILGYSTVRPVVMREEMRQMLRILNE
jgi:GntR family transcriptional regulator/MocR family aminotransferase